MGRFPTTPYSCYLAHSGLIYLERRPPASVRETFTTPYLPPIHGAPDPAGRRHAGSAHHDAADLVPGRYK